MENREAIEALRDLLDTTREYPHLDGMTMFGDAIDMAISALEKQEQTNTQSVNSMRTSRPNALESLNILEQAKDDKGCVTMSLVRQAFRNVLEQDRWIPVTERPPEEDDYRPCYGYDDGAVWWLNDIGMMGLGWYYASTEKWAFYDETTHTESVVGNVTAWRPLPEPYKAEEFEEDRDER